LEKLVRGVFENLERERSEKKRRRVWHYSRGMFATNSCPKKKMERKARNHFHGCRDTEQKEDEEEEDGKFKGERSRSTYVVVWSLGFALNKQRAEEDLIIHAQDNLKEEGES